MADARSSLARRRRDRIRSFLLGVFNGLTTISLAAFVVFFFGTAADPVIASSLASVPSFAFWDTSLVGIVVFVGIVPVFVLLAISLLIASSDRAEQAGVFSVYATVFGGLVAVYSTGSYVAGLSDYSARIVVNPVGRVPLLGIQSTTSCGDYMCLQALYSGMATEIAAVSERKVPGKAHSFIKAFYRLGHGSECANSENSSTWALSAHGIFDACVVARDGPAEIEDLLLVKFGAAAQRPFVPRGFAMAAAKIHDATVEPEIARWEFIHGDGHEFEPSDFLAKLTGVAARQMPIECETFGAAVESVRSNLASMPRFNYAPTFDYLSNCARRTKVPAEEIAALAPKLRLIGGEICSREQAPQRCIDYYSRYIGSLPMAPTIDGVKLPQAVPPSP